MSVEVVIKPRGEIEDKFSATTTVPEGALSSRELTFSNEGRRFLGITEFEVDSDVELQEQYENFLASGAYDEDEAAWLASLFLDAPYLNNEGYVGNVLDAVMLRLVADQSVPKLIRVEDDNVVVIPDYKRKLTLDKLPAHMSLVDIRQTIVLLKLYSKIIWNSVV